MQRSRTPLEEVVINQIYKGEYSEPNINHLSEMALQLDGDQGSHHGEHHVQN